MPTSDIARRVEPILLAAITALLVARLVDGPAPAVAAPRAEPGTSEGERVITMLEPNGFFAAGEAGRLTVLEWLPDTNPGVFPTEYGQDKPTVYFAVDGQFTTDWSRVRNGITVRAGGVIRNANPFRVQMQAVRR